MNERRETRRLGAPRTWGRRPGEPAVVGWLGPMSTPRNLLPRNWPVLWIWDLAVVDGVCENVDVVLADPRGARPRAFENRLLRIHEVHGATGKPELLLVPSRASEAWVGRYGSRLLPQDARPLGRRIHEEASQPLLHWVAEWFREAFGDSALVRRFLKYSLLQPIPTAAEAAEMLAEGRAPYIRTVPEMARRLGCGRSWLYGHLPFPPGRTLAVFTFVRGILLYCGARSRHRPDHWVTSWSVVALRLGFRDPTGWTHFCDRVAGLEPSRLYQRTVGQWIEKVLGLTPRGGGTGAARSAERRR